MSGDFECFVTIGDKKQSIYLDKDIDGVIFSDVYKQLTQLEANPVISFDNYIFEVFDFEDNCFQRLTSVEMPIKYLSRIRVLPKDSNNDNNNRNDNKQKGFKPKLNNDLFNSELIDPNHLNEDFYNVEAEDEPPVPAMKAKRPFGPNRYFHNNKKPNYSEPNPMEELEMSEDFYNDLYFNNNKRMKFRGYSGYGTDTFEYSGYSGSPVPSPKPYVRRSDMAEPIAGPSFADPYNQPPSPQRYYSPRDMTSPQEYQPFYRPNRPQINYRPKFSQNMNFRPDFNQRMFFRPNQMPLTINFQPNYTPFPQGFDSKRNQKRNRKRWEQQMTSESNKEKGFIKSPKTLSDLRINGFTVETINGFEFYFCEYCEIKFRPVYQAFTHIKTPLHQKMCSERNLDPLDKLLLVKTQKVGSEVYILRRQELRKISKLDKQKLVRHGIRLKDATGPQAYICNRCCSTMSTLTECHKHYDKFIEINKSINYPKDYHLLTEDNSFPKVELRYRRILNALELLIEENRSEEQLKQLIALRDEGVVLKESIDGLNKKYFSCLVCDKRVETNEEAMAHSKSGDHLRKRSIQRYRGLDKAFLMDSERSDQIEVVLARKQELEKIKFFTKEMNLEHGIRLKDGIGPEAYFCTKCDQWFDSSNMVKIHVDSYDKRLIIESTEESLIDSAKKQMELLSKQQTNDIKEEDVEQMDFTADEDNKAFSIENFDQNFEQQFTLEGIKSLATEDDKEGVDLKEPYYDIFCDIYFNDKEQVMHHLNRSFHGRCKSGELLDSIDKAFCVSTDNICDPEVAISRLQVLQRLSDEVKQKFTEEGIRLKDGIGREAFWCLLCNDSILSPNVESCTYSFINHINYNPKHVELLIAQNK